jgi:hypothetical protein
VVFIFNNALQAFKTYCAIWVRRSNFRHQASPRVSPRESTQRRKLELWAKNVREFCLNADFHVTFRYLLHAVKLRHGTDGFTSSPKEGVLRIFRPKNPMASAGCESLNLGTKGQHATSRLPKPLWVELHIKNVCIPCSFLVINVCNQGKNLCSPCRTVIVQLMLHVWLFGTACVYLVTPF